MNVYTQGDIVWAVVTFRKGLPSGLQGNAVDPEVVTFYYQPNGSPASETLTYTDLSVPTVGEIARLGVGRYISGIDTTDFLGDTLEVWPVSGGYQAVGWKRFTVQPVGGNC